MAKQRAQPKGTHTDAGKDALWKDFQSWLDEARSTGWSVDRVLGDFQRFQQRLWEIQEQEQRIRFFDSLVDQLRHTCFPSLDSEQELKLLLWRGHAYETLGAWEQALEMFQQVLELCRRKSSFYPYCSEAHLWIGHI
ncbi:MAG: hypothetical protein D6681_18440, partial [Calditrichaeota bacterium]